MAEPIHARYRTATQEMDTVCMHDAGISTDNLHSVTCLDCIQIMADRGVQISRKQQKAIEA